MSLYSKPGDQVDPSKQKKFAESDPSSGEMYSALLANRQDPASWEAYLTKLIRKRTVPVFGSQKPQLQNGYYTITDKFGVEYLINSSGLRSKPLDQLGDKPIIVGIGCSITHGIGLNCTETWIHKLAELMNCDYINISMPGHGLTVTSLYFTEIILPQFANIQGVFVYTPPPNRVDWIQYTDLDESQYAVTDQDLTVMSMISIIKDAGYTDTSRELLRGLEHSAFIQYTKDLKLIETNAELHNIAYSNLDSIEFMQTSRVLNNKHRYTKAQDGSHDGIELHQDIADEFFKQVTDK